MSPQPLHVRDLIFIIYYQKMCKRDYYSLIFCEKKRNYSLVKCEIALTFASN